MRLINFLAGQACVFSVLAGHFIFATPLIAAPVKPATSRGAASPLKTGAEKDRKPASEGATGTELRPVRAASLSNRRSLLGVGIGLGSNASFGNALTVHFAPFSFFETRAGIGYNTTGVKYGAGAGVNIPVGPLGFGLGAAFVQSGGNTGKVSVAAKFTPEGSSTAESVEAIRSYKVSAANYYSIYGTGHLNFAEALRLELAANWNKVISGNEIEFTGPMEYSTPLEVQNEEDVQPKFDTKARKKLDINGAGFSVGLQLRL